jgi:anhydro-N-acetylmuramic acid kinase
VTGGGGVPPGGTRYGGLLSGTSMDGIDAILLSVEGDAPEQVRWRVEAFATLPWEEALRGRMRRAMAEGGMDARGLARLHTALGEGFAAAFLAFLDEAGAAAPEVRALGSHGQTVWHEPPTAGGPPGEAGVRGSTLQLGDPATLAERTGIPVVSDFRARDMAAGGHGAPLVPWADRVLLHRPGTGRALQNLGGMGNVTFLPRDGAWDRVLGFDTGPGVALLDGAAAWASNGAEPFDEGGRRAARGQVREAVVEALLADPFFREAPPRSTGRERFGDARLRALVEGWEGDRDDLLASLVEVTARSVAEAYRDHLPAGGVDEVVLSGGGARNIFLAGRIEAALARALPVPVPVRTGAEALGIDPDAREAAAFALLAWAHLHGIPGSLPQVTGAAGPRVLGTLTP